MGKLNSDLSTRQLIIFFALVCPVAKLFIMPASYCYFSGKDCWLGILIQGAIDLFCLLAILFAIKNDGRSFFEILCSAFGKIGAKFVYFLLSLYFLLKAFITILEELLICYEVLYESTPKLIFFVPLFFAMFYSQVAGFNGVFRTIELFAPFFAFSFFGLGFLSLSSFDIEELFPILEFGFRPIGTGILAHIGWFGDFSVMLLVLNNARIEKKDIGKLSAAFSFGIFLAAAFCVVAVGIYGNSAPRQVFLLSKISKYSIAFSNLGRIDFLFIIILFLASAIYCCTLVTCASKCLTTVTGFKPWINALSLSVALAVFSIMSLPKTYLAVEILQSYSVVIFAPLQYGLPITLPILSHLTRNKGKSDERKQSA